MVCYYKISAVKKTKLKTINQLKKFWPQHRVRGPGVHPCAMEFVGAWWIFSVFERLCVWSSFITSGIKWRGDNGRSRIKNSAPNHVLGCIRNNIKCYRPSQAKQSLTSFCCWKWAQPVKGGGGGIICSVIFGVSALAECPIRGGWGADGSTQSSLQQAAMSN